MASSVQTATNQNWIPRVSTALAINTGMVLALRVPSVRANRELIPTERLYDHQGHHHSRCRQPQGDVRKGLKRRGPVDQGRPLQLDGQIHKRLAHDDDGELPSLPMIFRPILWLKAQNLVGVAQIPVAPPVI